MAPDMSVEALRSLVDRANGYDRSFPCFDELLAVVEHIVSYIDREQQKQNALVEVEQLRGQVFSLKEALANTRNELEMERAANPSASKAIAINAIESILKHNARLIANTVLDEVRPEAQKYIDMRLVELKQ